MASYPFSRTLYIYVNNAKAAENPAVAAYVDLYVSEAGFATAPTPATSPSRRPSSRRSADAWAAMG